MHREIAERTATLAVLGVRAPERVLDVGCGTGYLLRCLSQRLPSAQALVGLDPALPMVEVAQRRREDPRTTFSVGAAEQLPFPGGWFDLVISTTSFDHWNDQARGLAECARVLRPGGTLVLCDLFSAWLWPTLVAGRRSKARTKRRAERLIRTAGLSRPEWHDIYAAIIRAAVSRR